MNRIPDSAMTIRTVAANGKGLGSRAVRCYKRTVRRAMAVGAVFKMRRSSGTRKSILMTVNTTGGTRGRYKAAVIRRCCMGRAP